MFFSPPIFLTQLAHISSSFHFNPCFLISTSPISHPLFLLSFLLILIFIKGDKSLSLFNSFVATISQIAIEFPLSVTLFLLHLYLIQIQLFFFSGFWLNTTTMGAKTLFLIKTHFVFMSKKMVFLIRVLWVSFFSFLFTLFRFIGTRIFRLRKNSIAQYCGMGQMQQVCDTPMNMIKQGEGEESESLLRFRFPTFEEFARKDDVHFVGDQGLCVNSDDNCPFAVSSENVVGLEPVEDTVELQISSDVSMTDEPGNKTGEGRKSSENVGEMFVNFVEEIGDSRRDLMSVLVDDVVVNSTKNLGEPSQMVDNLVNTVHSVRHDAHFLSDDESLVSDSDLDSNHSSFRSSFIDSLSDGFLSDIDFQRAFEIDTLMEYDWQGVKLSSKKSLTEEDVELQNLSKSWGYDNLDDEDEDILQELKDMEQVLEDDHDSFHPKDACDDFEDEDEDILQEFKEMKCDLEDDHDNISPKDGLIIESESLSADNQSKSSEKRSLESDSVDVINTLAIGETNTEKGLHGEHQNLESSLVDETERKQNSEKSSSGEQLSSDSDDQNCLEREWEHQDLVEQLKMEIKKVQAIGLPTILEESESPKIMDDLKPWKIEHKYQYEGTMDELNMFYKSYREKMRKLDILNFQKMYAIGFLRLKDPLQSFTKGKISAPTLAATMSFDCWPCKPKPSSKIHPPSMKKFSRELESDLEMVYVGQMCLSWEFLCWEYGKALELWESDPHGLLHYNDVAEKFQIFQVLLTRFLEEELFEGPRVQHYVKNRCVLRSLIQVPAVRDDNYKNWKKERKVISRKEAITSLQLVEIIEESIRILWQFIRVDKDASNAVLTKYWRSSNVELQSPADANLLAEVRSTLLKKDKKMKELTRSENCVLKSIHRLEEDSDHVLHFFSRVDLKLVSRVLNMSRLSTEQLVWCSDKLHRINFVGRKLHVEAEPSILLFPCS
ncbi:hypothetical protein KSS87_021492 [Heliosperma pusillum]|nr:hypothetical protein KSS87_021492 [Heliosperma pusillum]